VFAFFLRHAMSNAVPAIAAGLSNPPAREHYLTTAKLLYIRDTIQAEQALATLPEGALGFDLEWPSNFRRGQQHRVALIQLATLDMVYLLQVSAMQGITTTSRLSPPGI
jgi:hypothetical protein